MSRLPSFPFPALCAMVALALAGCGTDTIPRTSLPEPSRNAAPFTRAYPGVVRVSGNGACTGVVIRPTAVLTAAHCVREGGLGAVLLPTGRASARRAIRHGPGTRGDARDIALLFFDEPVADGDLAYALGDRVSTGETVRLVGYGCGGKRTGTNVVYRISQYLELLAPPGVRSLRDMGPENRAVTCPGDSGAPLFRETPQGLRIVGILHAALIDGGDRLSAYIDVTRGVNRDFIERNLAPLR